MPCTYDFEVAAARYFQALGDGEVPLEFLFSGTVFYAGRRGALQTAQIAWDKEAEFRLPVSRRGSETMDRYFPGTAWLRLRPRALDRLAAYRAAHTLASWDATIDALLPARARTDGRRAPRSPTPCCTRATCCGPTAGRR